MSRSAKPYSQKPYTRAAKKKDEEIYYQLHNSIYPTYYPEIQAKANAILTLCIAANLPRKEGGMTVLEAARLRQVCKNAKIRINGGNHVNLNNKKNRERKRSKMHASRHNLHRSKGHPPPLWYRGVGRSA